MPQAEIRGRDFIALFGVTGLIGSSIADQLILEHQNLKLFSRNTERLSSRFPEQTVVNWNMATDSWKNEIDGATAVINFTGEPIFRRWNADYKRRIYDSRINTVQEIVRAIADSQVKPKVFINGTATGFYGYDRIDDTGMDEDSPNGNDFWGKLVLEWESAANKAANYGVRVVNIRTSMVLSSKGGSLPELVSVFRKDLGGPIKPGNQWFTWIHMDDEVGLVLWAMNNDNVVGPVNAVSPQSTTMKDFAKKLGKVLNKPSRINIPATLIKLRMGEVSALILRGKKIIPKKALELGYVFKYPDLEDALRSTLGLV